MNDNYLTEADIDYFKQQLDTIINQQFKSKQVIHRWNLSFDRDLKKFVFAISSNQPKPEDWFGWPVEIIAKDPEQFLNLSVLKMTLDVLETSKEINKNLFREDKDFDTESEWAIHIYLDNTLNLKIFNRAEFECGEYDYRDYDAEIINPNTIKEQIQNLIDFDENLREGILLDFLTLKLKPAIKLKLNQDFDLQNLIQSQVSN